MKIKTALQINKKSEEIFSAIIEPEKMKNYFISEASGKMEENKIITWKFAEFKDRFNIKVKEVIENKKIVYEWPSFKGKWLEVEIKLEAYKENATVVHISEGEVNFNEESAEWIQQNTQGWANFLACLKAWLEYGIKLREGSWDFMSDIK